MFLNHLTWLIGYRFRVCLQPKLKLPPDTPESLRGKEGAKEIKEKARASSAVAGVFLAFSAAFLVALVSTKDVLGSVLKPLDSPDCTLALALLGVVLPYVILREERRISAARVEAYVSLFGATESQTPECRHQSKSVEQKERQAAEECRRRRQHYFHLAILSVALIATFLPIFFRPSAGQLALALPLSGFFLIVLSVLLLVLSVEFYDTAASWQAGDDERYHFHMASIASHCYLLGLSLSLVGVSLLFCVQYPRTGCTIAVVVLVVLIGMTEVERELFKLRNS